MPRSSRPKQAAVAGQRVGTKRRDMRWQAPDGTIWASRFEYAVFKTLQEQGHDVRRCTAPDDSLPYTSRVVSGVCLDCGSARVATSRTYTPDLHLRPKSAGAQREGYFIEAKGYLRAERRALLRSLRKAWPSLDLRLVVQRDYRVTAGLTITQWATKYLKCPVIVWEGKLPKDWT